jgi:hypothetical protein
VDRAGDAAVISAKVKVSTGGIKFLVEQNKTRDVTLKGVRAAAKVLERAAKREAPKRTGLLRKAQGTIAKKGRKGTTTSFAVQGARKRIEAVVVPPGRKKAVRVVPAFYDHLVQGGTKPHSMGKVITEDQEFRVPGKLGYKTKQVRIGQAEGRRHSGAKKNPYRKRAWDASKSEAGEAAVKAMGEAQRKLIIQAATKTLSAK